MIIASKNRHSAPRSARDAGMPAKRACPRSGHSLKKDPKIYVGVFFHQKHMFFQQQQKKQCRNCFFVDFSSFFKFCSFCQLFSEEFEKTLKNLVFFKIHLKKKRKNPVIKNGFFFKSGFITLPTLSMDQRTGFRPNF